MKKVLIFTILFFIFPIAAFAKTLNISAYIDSNIKENIDEIIVSFESSTGEDGVVDYSLTPSKSYKTTVTNFSDEDEVNFLYGTLVVDKVVDSIGQYNVECTDIKENNGVYTIVLKVTDPSIVVTTNVQDNTKKEDNAKERKIIAYGIIGIVSIVLLIFILLVLIKVLRASNMY